MRSKVHFLNTSSSHKATTCNRATFMQGSKAKVIEPTQVQIRTELKPEFSEEQRAATLPKTPHLLSCGGGKAPTETSPRAVHEGLHPQIPRGN